jgi:hypothetical protein
MQPPAPDPAVQRLDRLVGTWTMATCLGWSWRQIATLLGVSKQAVHQKYGKAEQRPRRGFG